MHRSYRVPFAAAGGTMQPMAVAEATALGYRELLRVPTYSWLVSALFLSRLANAMSQVAVVIYLLERTGSPAMTGIGAAAQLLPAIATGPLVGAWLDRVPSRTGLVAATQTVRGLLLVTLVAVGELVNPPAAVYILILAGLGLTFPLPNPGFRALIPLLVPRPLWVRANTVDSIAYDASFVIGPALAAAVVTGVGAPFAIVLQAGATFAAALAARRVREPAGRPLSTEPAFQAAWIGLRAVWTHVELRATMVLMFVSGIGFGVFTIGLPLWARDQLGHSAGASGWMWTAISAGSIIGGLTYGARRPAGSDSRPRGHVHRPGRPAATAGAVRALAGRRHGLHVCGGAVHGARDHLDVRDPSDGSAARVARPHVRDHRQRQRRGQPGWGGTRRAAGRHRGRACDPLRRRVGAARRSRRCGADAGGISTSGPRRRALDDF
jgi:MFS family permease